MKLPAVAALALYLGAALAQPAAIDTKKVAAPVDAQNAPVEAKAAPVEVRKSTPVEAKAAPVEAKAAPVEAKATPAEAKKAPVAVKKAAAAPVDDDPTKKLPAELTLTEFDKITSQQLTFVEFYSPYCSHCKQFAPTWKKAYFLTEEDQKLLNIAMRQVNCVESGDLCQREQIHAYPNLRLYAPEGDKQGKFVDSFPRLLTRTPENIKKYLINLVAEFNAGAIDIPSSSELVDIDLGMRIVAGEIDEPYFVALFSSSKDQYTKTKFPPSCLDCVEHKQTLEKLSNFVVSVAKTGALNCHSHPILCEKLGFTELSQPDLELAPRYVMFVPKESGLIRHDYTGEVSVKEMKHFVTKLAANSKYEEITARDLEDMGVLLTELLPKPQDLFYPLANKMLLVFAYDKKKVVPEDKAIMPYLLEMVTKLPFTIGLYASKSVKFEQMIEDQAHALLDFVNADASFETHLFNKHMHLATTLTAKPTLYIFKENSLIPAVFQNFAIEDMRMPEKIEAFIKKNMFPLYGELTPKLFPYYFDKTGLKNSDDDKVVITFLDTTNAEHVKQTLFNLSRTAHQYTLEKKEYYFKDLLEARDAKRERVAKLKAKNVDTATVIQEMRTLIPHLFDHDDVLFTYVDMQEYPNFADTFGLNIDGKTYKAGDTIVVSKNQMYYWDQDLSGNGLRADVGELRLLLKFLLDPVLVPSAKTKLQSKLVGSPYHRTLRVFDFVHEHGFLGYVAVLGLMFVAVHTVGRLRRRRRVSSNTRRGLIGTLMAKSD